MNTLTPPRPLAGVKVLDLSRVLAGPWAGQLLADYGADVIKVERPGSGDDTRGWGPPWWGEGEARVAAYYLCTNRGKRSVAIDIATPEGQALVRSLAREADVLIENYRVGQLAKYGLDGASLQRLNPGLVYCSITGYGQSGPYAQRAGYDFAIQAQGGLMSITGEAGGEPQKVGVAVVDLMTGVYATTAILAALHERQRTGRGRQIDAALLDVQVAMLANQASNYLVSGTAPTRMGNAHPNIVPYQVFATADGHLVLAVGNDAQFVRACEVLGLAALARDERYTTNAGRVKHRAALVPELQRALLARPALAWVDAFEAAGVPCAPILDVAQVFDDPHVRARGLRARAAPGQPPGVLTPMCFDGQRPLAPSAPPPLDADGEAVRAAAQAQRWPSR
jgi:crotonobetainyl-CoA:carnitine CoA-transferase CaiB-like acyl-CoA transferase